LHEIYEADLKNPDSEKSVAKVEMKPSQANKDLTSV
jgi:hypothetical protein